MNEKKVRKGETIEHWIARAPDAQGRLLTRLRKLINKTCPNLEERVRWAHPSWGVEKTDLFSISWHAGHVNLHLWQGAHLLDPEGIVEGTGKNLRHVKLRLQEEPDEGALRELLRASLDSAGL